MGRHLLDSLLTSMSDTSNALLHTGQQQRDRKKSCADLRAAASVKRALSELRHNLLYNIRPGNMGETCFGEE